MDRSEHATDDRHVPTDVETALATDTPGAAPLELPDGVDDVDALETFVAALAAHRRVVETYGATLPELKARVERATDGIDAGAALPAGGGQGAAAADALREYRTALEELGLADRHVPSADAAAFDDAATDPLEGIVWAAAEPVAAADSVVDPTPEYLIDRQV